MNILKVVNSRYNQVIIYVYFREYGSHIIQMNEPFGKYICNEHANA